MGTVRKWTFESRELWLTARVGFIGGSDAACVLGLNPWKSNVELWEEKMQIIPPKDISDNPLVEYGTKAEDHLRELFALDFPEYKVEYTPFNYWTNSLYPWAHASLDGELIEEETDRHGILEIKTSTANTGAQRAKWDDRIPDNYYAQVLHYLAVTEFDFAILKAQLKTDYTGDIRLDTRHYKIERADVEEDIQILMDAEREFYEAMRDNRRPALILPRI